MNQKYHKMMVCNIYHSAWCKFTYFNLQDKQRNALKTKSIYNWITILWFARIFVSQSFLRYILCTMFMIYLVIIIWRKDEQNTTPSLLIQSAGSECNCCCGCELQMSIKRPILCVLTDMLHVFSIIPEVQVFSIWGFIYTP